MIFSKGFFQISQFVTEFFLRFVYSIKMGDNLRELDKTTEVINGLNDESVISAATSTYTYQIRFFQPRKFNAV